MDITLEVILNSKQYEKLSESLLGEFDNQIFAY